jgi:GTP-binding protein HflX
MVGYTNAGKSTLMRTLSGADVLIEDRLFATLDTTVRKVELAPSKEILLSDTVGFIRKLPSHLIASFRSTLSELAEADVLLHVVDITHPQFRAHIAVVTDTIDGLNAAGKPTIYVFNKIDKLELRSIVVELKAEYPSSVFISAERGIAISTLTDKLQDFLEVDAEEHELRFDQSEYGIIARLHEIAEILGQEYEGNSILVRFKIIPKHLERLQKLLGRKFEMFHPAHPVPKYE